MASRDETSSATRRPARTGLFGTMRARLRNRPDSEHEMTINRMVFATLVVAYLVIGSLLDDAQVESLTHSVGLGAAIYTFGAVALFAHILARPGISPVRRVLAMLLDLWTVTYGAYVGGETMAFFYPLYLWTILGNGFRFGVSYLRAAMLLSLAGLAFALIGTGFWSQHRGLSIGLLAGVLILPLYCSTLIRKLSDAKRQAEEASRAKSLFLASVSHELRTPLNVIIGASDLLRPHQADEEGLDMVRMIGTAGRSLLGLINSLLDFSRLEAGRMPSHPTDFDLFELAAHVRALMSVQARAKGLALNVFLAPDLPAALHGDRRHLEEILINLTGNAVKFTDAGHVQIAVSRLADTGGRVRLRFEVRDTGIGIAPQAQARIFESFTQADETIIDRFGGTGLGLAICRQLVELHGGEIGLESEPGNGSTFWFEIDYALAESVQAEVASEGQMLLLTQDHRLAAMAQALPATVHLAENADQAEAMLARLKPAQHGRTVAVLDQRLCGSDFAAIAARLRDADPGQKLVLVAACETGMLMTRAEQIACVSAIERPLAADALLGATRIAFAVAHGGAPAQDAAQEGHARRSFRILVAEDNRTNQMIIRKVLERAGHVVTIAGDGEEALTALREHSFDAVLMDINMPVMNGIEATKLYRFISVGQKRIPIIALTADASPEAQRRCTEAGMDACLNKPIDPATLFLAIDRLVPEEDGAAIPIDPASGVVAIESHPRFGQPGPGGLNEAAIEGLMTLGGPAFVQELVTAFASESAGMMEELAEAVARDDVALFGERIHALRSCAANIGAQSVFERCVAWRDITAEELGTRGEEYLALLRAELDTACTRLEAYAGDPRRTGTA